jgi:hypothetical protein
MDEALLKSVFKAKKPIIGMVHTKPLPGAPLYKENEFNLLELLESDLIALQEGGIDAVMFSNEDDRPYQTTVDPATVATMSYLIGKLAPKIKVPFGVDILFDPMASLAVAKATGACFVREIFTGAYGGDLGLWSNRCDKIYRYRKLINADDIVCVHNINAEFAYPLDTRPIEKIAKSVVFSSLADIIAVSGNITGEEVSIDDLKKVKDSIPNTPVFANTGISVNNVEKILKVCDGAIVGTSLKKDSITWNNIEKERVISLMQKVNMIRNKG